MERKPQAGFEEPSEEHFSEAEAQETQETQEAQDTQQPKESEFVRNTRHAAENAQRLGLDLESFQALSLRNRTVLSFFNVPEDYSEAEPQSNDDQLVFMTTGAKLGDTLLPYTPEIQQKIHEDYLRQQLRIPDFGKKLFEENQGWQAQLVEEEQKTLTTQANRVFRDIMRSKFADPSELIKNSGLETDEFLDLIQIEDSVSPTNLVTDFLENAHIELPKSKALSWHLENTQYYRQAHADIVTEEQEKTAEQGNAEATTDWRSIKRVYDSLISKTTKRSYRPLKENYVRPYRLPIKYDPLEKDNNFKGKKGYIVNLDQRFEAPKTSINEAIDSIVLFCEQHELELNLGDINIESPEIDSEQIDKFIEQNTETINKYFDEHYKPFRDSRDKLNKYVISLRRQYPKEDDGTFVKTLKSSRAYEGLLRNIYHEARYLDIINIIYNHASPSYLDAIKSNQNQDARTIAIIEEYKDILDEAEAKGLQLRSATTKLDEAQEVLKSKYGITDKIGEHVEEILHAHHEEFSAALRKDIDTILACRSIKDRYKTQEDAREALDKRILQANTENQDDPIQQSDYLPKLKALGNFAFLVNQLKRSIHGELYLQYRSKFEESLHGESDAIIKIELRESRELDLIHNTLDLPLHLDKKTLLPKEELIEKLKKLLESHRATGDPDQYIQDFIANEERSCELKIKLALSSKRNTERAPLPRKRSERDLSIPEQLLPNDVAKMWANTYIKQHILDRKIQNIAKSLGYPNRAQSILFMPGFMVIHDNDNQSSILPFNPETIKKSADPTLTELTPFVDKAPFCSMDEISTARNTLNHILQLEMLKNESVGASKLERRLLAFQEKTGIDFPQAGIESSTGQLRAEPTEAELNGLETIYPFFGRFIAHAEKTTDHSTPETLVESMQKRQKAFICNETQSGENIIFQDSIEGRSVKLEKLANLLRAKSIDGAKALELAAFDAAICDYSTLSNAEISQYLKAVQGKIPADARTFMLLYQKAITNPVELRKCAIKLSYCREFARYCAGGAATPELESFFDERARKAKGQKYENL